VGEIAAVQARAEAFVTGYEADGQSRPGMHDDRRTMSPASGFSVGLSLSIRAGRAVAWTAIDLAGYVRIATQAATQAYEQAEGSPRASGLKLLRDRPHRAGDGLSPVRAGPPNAHQSAGRPGRSGSAATRCHRCEQPPTPATAFCTRAARVVSRLPPQLAVMIRLEHGGSAPPVRG
jgi:hypothetical protein